MTSPTPREMKSASRLYAVQALFQMEHSSLTIDKVRTEFEDHRFGAIYEGDEMIEGDISHFRQVLETAVENQAKIDQLTDRALVEKWPIARIVSRRGRRTDQRPNAPKSGDQRIC